MASTWSDNLKIELLGTGDTNWGNLTNNNFKWAIEESITGYGTATFPSDADYDWGAGFTNSNSSQAQRNLVIRVTGTLSTTRNLIVPLNSAGTAPIEKQYIFWNDTTGGQAIVVKTPSGTGVTIPNGVRMHVFVDGTNVVQMDNYDVSRTIGTLSLTNALTVTNGGTGITAFGTGVATALGQNVTGSGGMVLATSPTLTTPNLGTPSAATLTNATGLPIDGGTTGTLPVNRGGTGATSLTANNVLLGNGTSAVQVVAPGSSGNVLTSNGTTWASSALPANVSSLNGQTGAITNTSVNSIGSCIVALYVPGTHPGTSGTSLNVNDTASGSTLYYNYSNSSGSDFNTGVSQGSSTYAGGGTTLSGTWRCMGRPGYVFSNLGSPSYTWQPGLFVRVS